MDNNKKDIQRHSRRSRRPIFQTRGMKRNMLFHPHKRNLIASIIYLTQKFKKY